MQNVDYTRKVSPLLFITCRRRSLGLLLEWIYFLLIRITLQCLLIQQVSISLV